MYKAEENENGCWSSRLFYKLDSLAPTETFASYFYHHQSWGGCGLQESRPRPQRSWECFQGPASYIWSRGTKRQQTRWTQLLPFIKGIPFYGRDTITESHNWSNSRRQLTTRCPTPNDKSIIQPLHLRLKEHHRRGGARGRVHLLWDSVSYICQGICIQEISKYGLLKRDLHNDNTSWHFSMNWENLITPWPWIKSYRQLWASKRKSSPGISSW